MHARHKTRKPIFRCFFIICLMLAFFPGASNAEKNKIKSATIMRHNLQPGLVFYFSPDREEHFKSINAELERGLVRLYDSFDRVALQTKPRFWLIGEESLFQHALRTRKKLSKNAINLATRHKVYRDHSDIFINYLEGVDRDEIMRLIFQEYSRRLMESKALNFKRNRIGWFHTGLPTYMSWYIMGEIQNQSLVETHAAMIRYYCVDFDPEFAIELSRLERETSFKFASDSNPRLVFSQSVLAYMYLSSKARPQAGLMLLTNLRKAEDFSQEFERVSGMRLFEFEKSMREKLYPEIESWRKRLKIRRKQVVPGIRLQTYRQAIFVPAINNS